MELSPSHRANLENLRRSMVMCEPDQRCTMLTNHQASRLIGELIEALDLLAHPKPEPPNEARRG